MKIKQEKEKQPDIGGQAVMEGVMMKSPTAIAVSVRRTDGRIAVKHTPYTPLSKKHSWMGWPFIRGIINMGVMLSMGMKTIRLSADMMEMEEEPTKFELWLSKKLGKGIDKIVMYTAVVLAVILAVGLFFALPQAIGAWLRSFIGSKTIVNLLEALIRMTILLAYMAFCGAIPEIKRTFMYHGAEHKTVYCHEHGEPLTPENAEKFSSLHPRCGTSFLVIVFVLAFLVYTVCAYNGPVYIWRLLSRLALLPLVAGVSFEMLKGLAHHDAKWVRALRWPGMQVQRLTTKKPDPDMIEVAICSMNIALHGLPRRLIPDEKGLVYLSSYTESEPEDEPPDEARSIEPAPDNDC
jgi:uncharacterized protein YqhQ